MMGSAKLTESQTGNALLELALVLPLLLAFFAAGVEFTRALRYYEFASALSRVLASVAFRQCSGRNAQDTGPCLDRLRAPLEAGARQLVAGTQLPIGIYDYDETSGQYRRLGLSPVAADTGTSNVIATRFGIVGGAPIAGIAGTSQGTAVSGQIGATTVRNNRVVAISETFIPYSPMIQAVLGIFSAKAGLLYDATIL